jgi:hypothetical protein
VTNLILVKHQKAPAINMKLFEEINVWERDASANAVCYKCLKLLPDQGYCVQSADFYNSEALQKNMFAIQFVELFIEASPDLRIEPKPTLELAIAHFKDQFNT